MHQNAPLPDKKAKKISGEGARPPQTPHTLGRGIPPPRPTTLDSALGAFPFLFIYDSNTDRDVPVL